MLVAERAQVQKDAALEAERSGGGDSKALTRAVAGHQEAQARLDALVEVIGEKRSAVETAQLALSAAVRAEAEAKRKAEVAHLRARCEVITREVRDGFERLSHRGRKFGAAIHELDRLDRSAAQAVAGQVASATLRADLVRRGAVGVGEGDGQPHALVVPAAVLSPELVAAGRAVVTVDELVARMQRTEPEQAA